MNRQRPFDDARARGGPPADHGAVTRYASLDLGAQGPAWADLSEAVEHEAYSDDIKLSDHVGELPPNLTPGMRAWFDFHVHPARKAALDAVAARFGAIGEGKGATGVFLERQLDRIEDARLNEKRQALRAHREKNAAAFAELDQAHEDAEKARIRFEKLEMLHNRAPRVPPRWYVPALILLLPAEGGINFETFLAVEWMTPAYAMGSVVILGLLLALSAHLYGTLLRQAKVLFDPSQDDIDRLVGWRMLGMGSFALTVVLGAVWYARAAYFADRLRVADVLGGEVPSAFMTIGGSLLGNVAVWLGGVILAFLLHDPDPQYPDALQDRKKKSARLKRLQEDFRKPLHREFERIDAIARREREQAENHVRAMSHMPEYQEARNMFARVAEQDARAVALLSAYRGRLVGAMRDRDVYFEMTRELAGEEARLLTKSEYLAEPLTLKYL